MPFDMGDVAKKRRRERARRKERSPATTGSWHVARRHMAGRQCATVPQPTV